MTPPELFQAPLRPWAHRTRSTVVIAPLDEYSNGPGWLSVLVVTALTVVVVVVIVVHHYRGQQRS